MSEQQANLILEMLRAIRSDVAGVKTDVIEIKERLGILDSQYASLSRRVDRTGGDVDVLQLGRNQSQRRHARGVLGQHGCLQGCGELVA